MNKSELIEKICKRAIVVFGVLAIFNFILLINKKSYALFTKTITSDKTVVHIETGDRLPAVNVIKNTIGKPGGVIGIKTDNTSTTDKINVREYRYSGLNVNNYIYFNCNNETTKETASANCETWRIVGIFKDEDGQEHLKIVKNEIIKGEIMPLTYTIGGIEYKIRYNSSSDGAYWNYKVGGINNNDWATAGLQYWLNTGKDETAESSNKGYLSTLKGDTLSMIEETKYYLGTIIYKYIDTSNYGIIETTKEAYVNERAITECEGGIGPAENSSPSAVEGNKSCKVWAGNKTTWEGKVALLYASDYGFTADSTYWKDTLLYQYYIEAVNTSWLYKTGNHGKSYEWFLSPSSERLDDVSTLASTGFVSNHNGINNYLAVRPCLYLKNNVKITSGNGTSEQPYFIEL